MVSFLLGFSDVKILPTLEIVEKCFLITLNFLMQIAMAPYNTPLFGGDWYVTRGARKKEYIQRRVDELE